MKNSSLKKSDSKFGMHPLITGTIILTITGLITRTIGFFYRIYLSRLFGEEGMGIYQLVNPVLSLSFALTAAGFQTAISKLVAESLAGMKHPSVKPMIAGFTITIPLSALCTFFIYSFADFLGNAAFGDSRTIPMIKILALSIPFAAIHACINGYFYGRKKAGVPAGTQLIEQLARVACVFLITQKSISKGQTPDICVATWGLTIAEFISMAAAIAAMYIYYSKELALVKNKSMRAAAYIRNHGQNRKVRFNYMSIYGGLLAMAVPLSANRIILNILASIESVSIPSALRSYGYDNSTALSVYGVLTGMAMPFIFFPNAITGSISVLLLPMISEKNAYGDTDAIKRASFKTVKYCFILGFIFLSIFVVFGDLAGRLVFDSSLAGYFIKTLGFLCPFLYLDSTLSSILQGLGMAGRIFVMNLICMLIRMGFVFFAIPIFGIKGYLWGMLFSQILLCAMFMICLWRFIHAVK